MCTLKSSLCCFTPHVLRSAFQPLVPGIPETSKNAKQQASETQAQERDKDMAMAQEKGQNAQKEETRPGRAEIGIGRRNDMKKRIWRWRSSVGGESKDLFWTSFLRRGQEGT